MSGFDNTRHILATARKRDFYEILSVSKTASAQEIKTAYRKLAVKYHPDKNAGNKAAEEAFKEAAEAYSVLGDEEKRSIYDQYGHAGLKGGVPFNQDVFREFSDIFGGSLFEDLFGFGDLFGGRSRRGGPRRGADLRFDLEIGFEEAVKGTETKIRVPRLESCDKCGGGGAAPGTSRSTCSTCGGQGQIRYQQGFLAVARTCGRCYGSGSVVTNPCPECHGQGRLQKERQLTLKIPAGVDQGSRLRMSGEGEAGAGGGPAGDLYVVLNVAEHPFFKRQEDDIFCQVPVTFPQAALGAQVEVPTLDGVEALTIPEGTQSGTVFRLKGKGVPRLRGHGRGDQLVAVLAVTPSRLTKEQRRLMKQLAEITPPLRIRPEDFEKEKGFLERLFGY